MTVEAPGGKQPQHRRVKLSTHGVSKTFGQYVALHPTDIELKEGEFLTLLGPSGSGKTTLLTMVAGLQLPDSGEILIDGAVSTYAPSHARDIGMVFQNYALFPHLSVFENIAFPLRMRKVPESEIRRRVGEILDIVSLPNVADRLPSALSGGQQQRIALARCIVYRPSIILMDEPLSALDRKLREQLQNEIRNLHKSLGTTILFVTHDQDEAMTMSDRICVMSQGRVEQVGAPYEVYARPSTLFVADFLGNSNLLPVSATGLTGATGSFRSDSMTDVIIEAVVPSGLATGTRATLMVRPEHLHFSSTLPMTNGLAATVEDRAFVGSILHYTLRHARGARLHLTALSSGLANMPGIGASVFVGWRPENAAVINETAGPL